MVNKQPHDSEQMVAQYKNWNSEFGQQKHIIYNEIYQQGYSSDHVSKKFRRQYKPLDTLHLF